ncbi:MAG TPA: M48 family metallopeptidase [Bryobacteraceae bacterium]
MSYFIRTLFAALLAAMLGAGQGLPRLKPGFNFFSKQQDIALGREAAQQVSQKYQVVRDTELSSYLARLGARLAARPEADSADFPYSFTLVRDKTINAFALPGGPTFVHTGLILAAENEAQVAGVLAHEISHVALRHGTHQATKAMGVQLVAGLLSSEVGQGSLLGQLTQAGLAFGANSVLLKYSRDAEKQADLLGVQILSGAGYNPIEMARFFERLEADGGARGPQFFSDHPNPGNRVSYIEDTIRYLPRAEYTPDTGQFRRIQDRVRKLPGGTSGK